MDLIGWIFTVLSILGGQLVTSLKTKIRLIAFIIWLISDIWWISFNFYFHHWSPAVLFSVYSIQCIIGIYNNSKKEKSYNSNKKIGDF